MHHGYYNTHLWKHECVCAIFACVCVIFACVCAIFACVFYLCAYAIFALYVSQSTMLQGIERYMKQAIVDKVHSVSSAALTSALVSHRATFYDLCTIIRL